MRVGARNTPLTGSAVKRVRRQRALIAVCVIYIVALCAFLFGLRELGDRTWYGTVLLVLPRWPIAVALVPLLVWVVVARRWVPWVLFVLMAWLALGPIMGVRLALPAEEGVRGDLRILSCNIHRRQLDPVRLRAYIERVRPDIVALQDWTSSHQEALFDSAEWKVERLGELLVASRYPITEVIPIDLVLDSSIPPGEQGEATLFVIDTPHGRVSMVNLHFASPHNGLLDVSKDRGVRLTTNVARRTLEHRLTRARVDQIDGPVVVVGDFNTGDPSPLLREHWGSFQDVSSEARSGLGYTYRNNHTQLRIDHILANGAWKVVWFEVGPDVGSPHFPIVGDVTFR